MAERNNMADRNAERDHDAKLEEAGLDQRLRVAMGDVPLPDGLAERLKQAVNARLTSHSFDLQAADDAPATLSISAHTTHSARAKQDRLDESTEHQSSGQYLRRGALVGLFAAAVCGFAWVAHQWRQPAEKSWLVAHCQAIIGKWEEDNPANMEMADPALAYAQLPEAVRSQLTRLNALGQRNLSAIDKHWTGQLLRCDAGDGRAIVVLRLPKLRVVRGLNSRFEVLPTTSGAWSLAALTIGEETYVLAANCTQQQLVQYIRRAAIT